MNNRTSIIGFRESPEVIAKIDSYAKERGIDRSDALRMIVREKFREATE